MNTAKARFYPEELGEHRRTGAAPLVPCTGVPGRHDSGALECPVGRNSGALECPVGRSYAHEESRSAGSGEDGERPREHRDLGRRGVEGRQRPQRLAVGTDRDGPPASGGISARAPVSTVTSGRSTCPAVVDLRERADQLALGRRLDDHHVEQPVVEAGGGGDGHPLAVVAGVGDHDGRGVVLPDPAVDDDAEAGGTVRRGRGRRRTDTAPGRAASGRGRRSRRRACPRRRRPSRPPPASGRRPPRRRGPPGGPCRPAARQQYVAMIVLPRPPSSVHNQRTATSVRTAATSATTITTRLLHRRATRPRHSAASWSRRTRSR